jgi:uncharacterized membrane protein
MVKGVFAMAPKDVLRDAIEADSKAHYRWLYFWLVFYFILGALLWYGYAIAKDVDNSHLLLIAAILTTLGFLGVIISPLTGMMGPGVSKAQFLNPFKMLLDPYRDRLNRGDTDPTLRAHAEMALRGRAKAEKVAWSLPNRMVSIVVVIVLSLILWLAFDMWATALANFVIATGIAQELYYTQPNQAYEAVENELPAPAGAVVSPETQDVVPD